MKTKLARTRIVMSFLAVAVVFLTWNFSTPRAQAEANEWEYVGGENPTGTAWSASLAINPSTEQAYLAYIDYDNEEKVSVKKFNGTSWEVVGSAGFSQNTSDDVKIAFNPATNEPYVAYYVEDFGMSVKRFDGTSWVDVGDALFGDAQIAWTDFAFNPGTNVPYVAYTTETGDGFVDYLNGDTWDHLGIVAFSFGTTYVSLAFNPSNNRPYVAFNDDDNTYKLTVEQYNGSVWEPVGSAGFSEGAVTLPSIAFNPSNNVPYVIYTNTPANAKYVRYFDGDSWESIGDNSDFPSTLDCYEISFNSSTNEPYVACESTDYQLMIKKFDGSNWSSVGDEIITDSRVYYSPSIVFHPSTNEPWVAYDDYTLGGSKVIKYNSNQVASPVADPAAGIYGSSQTVTLSSATAGASIYYNINADHVANASDTLYTGPITISESSTLSAIAVKETMDDSDAITQGYTIGANPYHSPVYRFWSDTKQGHFYTASEDEKDYIIAHYPTNVWHYEGVGFRAYTEEYEGLTAVYRFWSDEKQGHFYTASAAEKDYIIAHYPENVWNYEGVAFYVFASIAPGTQPVYRFWSDEKQHHFYTNSLTERNYVIDHYDDRVWLYEGIAWYEPVD